MLNVVALLPGSRTSAAQATASDLKVTLTHDERHVRRRAISLGDGRKALVDFERPVVLQSGDVLELADGSFVEIAAALEPLYQVIGRDGAHLVELAWHIGNRHLPASLEAGRILILRDHVTKAMLEGLGATVEEIIAPFTPARGAYDAPEHHHHGGEGPRRHPHADHHHHRD